MDRFRSRRVSATPPVLPHRIHNLKHVLYPQKQLVRPIQDLAKGASSTHPTASHTAQRTPITPQSYTFDPFANISSAQRHLVLGGKSTEPASSRPDG